MDTLYFTRGIYYAEACNELVGLIFASLHPGNTAFFEEMLQRWRAIGYLVSGLTGPRFEPSNSRSRGELVIVRATGQSSNPCEACHMELSTKAYDT